MENSCQLDTGDKIKKKIFELIIYDRFTQNNDFVNYIT